ncbi:hypothetical protein BDM02DRAFT_3145073 [Thelephora ganbajun]|uniref:Uncharacterized protein n=1 Tax=Thelephora ganbajun TaxID=370292 RepID=A0ACB6ZEQ0_THEGA|nr:hypothetical protein BDM02DRAFT_3145073 [Thelephora ganbajun]
MASPSPPLTFEECVRSPSASSLSSWHPSTPPSEPSPPKCMPVAETLPSTSHSLVAVEEIGRSTSVDGVHAPQDFPFPEASCVSGLFGNGPGMFDFVPNPMQTGYWGDVHSHQAWTSNPSTQLAQSATSPSIQGNSDRISSPVDSHSNNLLPSSGISRPLNVAPIVSDAMTGAAFTMTCPIPHCYFQCQTVLDMWKHVTWTHVRPNSKESGIESIVERVVLGGLS